MRNNTLIKIIADVYHTAYEFCRRHALALISIFEFIGTYFCMHTVVQTYIERGEFRIGGEWLIPIFIFTGGALLRELARRAHIGDTMPRPRRRLTHIDPDGIVWVEQERTNELLLYVADLEDWLGVKE